MPRANAGLTRIVSIRLTPEEYQHFELVLDLLAQSAPFRANRHATVTHRVVLVEALTALERWLKDKARSR